MTKDNVIYITGDTYPHREALSKHATFDQALKLYVAPISRINEVKELSDRCNLKYSEQYQEDFFEPSNEKEWEIFKVKSLLSSNKYRIEELKISGSEDVESKTIKDKQISIDKLESKLKKLEEELKSGQTKGFKFRSITEIKESGEDWINTAPPPQPVLLKRKDGKVFLPKGDVGIVCATGGVGKTRMLAQLSFCLSAGIDFLDQFEKEGGGESRVFLGLGEEPIDGMRRRLHSIFKYYKGNKEYGNIDFDKVSNNLVPYSFFGETMTMLDKDGYPTEQYDRLLNELKRTQGDGYDLIILDPASRFFPTTSEIDNSMATRFVALMERATQELKGNPAVLLAHHMSKSGDWRSASAARGSSGLTDASRWVLNMVNEAESDPKHRALCHGTKKLLQGFVRADIVKRNNVPPLEEDIILKFSEEGGVLIPACESEIESVKKREQSPAETTSNNDYGKRYG